MTERDADAPQHTQGNKAREEEASKEADDKINEIQAAGKKGQDKIIKDLLAAVFEAHPTPVS
jgi:V-type H+-transporting ATPase subunit G